MGQACHGHNSVIFAVLVLCARPVMFLPGRHQRNIMTWLVSINLPPKLQIIENDFVLKPRASNRVPAVRSKYCPERAGEQTPDGLQRDGATKLEVRTRHR